MSCLLGQMFLLQRFTDPNLISWVILIRNSILFPKMFKSGKWYFQLALMHSRPTQTDNIYLINWSLDGVLILLTYANINNKSWIFFSCVPITWILIEFFPSILYILCIRSNLFLPEVFRYQPHNLGTLDYHLFIFAQEVLIGQRYSQRSFMPHNMTRMYHIYLIN